MTNATLRGKPDAGNPHVRFDEGEVAPAKPGRGSLLYKANSATIAFRVKPEIKRRADMLFERLGMTTSTGMNILLMQTLEHHGFPFAIVVNDEAEEVPNATTRAAMEDLDANRNLTRYDSVDALLEDA